MMLICSPNKTWIPKIKFFSLSLSPNKSRTNNNNQAKSTISQTSLRALLLMRATEMTAQVPQCDSLDSLDYGLEGPTLISALLFDSSKSFVASKRYQNYLCDVISNSILATKVLWN